MIHFSHKANRSGAILPLVAILFPLLLLLSAVAINVAYMQLSRTELGIATDAAGRAAGRMFAITHDEGLALEAANEAGALNFVAGRELEFSPDDLEFGKSIRVDENARFEFVSAPLEDSNAVRTFGNRSNSSLSGPVQTFLPGILGVQDFELEATAISTRIGADIVLVLDRSGSMAYSDSELAIFPPLPASAPAGWDFGDHVPPDSRWLDAFAATRVLLRILNRSPGEELISLVTYSDSGRIDAPLSDNTADVLKAMSEHSSAFEGGGTNISGGLTAAASELSSDSARRFSSKVIVVLTDGRVSAGPDPIPVARRLAKRGILIITVTFSNEADQELMRQVARVGNGFHRHANVKQELRAVFREISRNLPTLLTQ